jgi:hypothetical protein
MRESGLSSNPDKEGRVRRTGGRTLLTVFAGGYGAFPQPGVSARRATIPRAHATSTCLECTGAASRYAAAAHLKAGAEGAGRSELNGYET